MRIRPLALEVANQIAAGEVIERPASVVKELLENALDAKATQIIIQIGYGGLNLIKVSDDGIGIHPDDLFLAIAPHATSKIHTIDDLFQIESQGFRGEALASIASICKMELISKTKNAKSAKHLKIAGSNKELLAAPRNTGTTVIVKDLFYNVPVRKRFLRSPKSEFLAIERVVKCFALGAMQIAISLYHDEKIILQLPIANCERSRLNRIQKILGKRFLDNSIAINVKRSGLQLTGWISNAIHQLSQGDRQWLYLNERMIKDKLLQHAVRQSYENLLYPGRYPVYVLYFTIAPKEVDVNVHPTKHEVRFHEPRVVHDFIAASINEALSAVTQPAKNKPQQKMVNSQIEKLSRGSNAGNLYGLEDEDILWMPLNTTYVLVIFFKTDKSYILNASLLQEKYFNDKISKENKPLANRPILVPIKVMPKIEINNCNFHKLLPMLQKYGLECKLDKQKNYILQSIPICLPQLDVKTFFDSLKNISPGEEACLVKILIAANIRDVQLLDKEERMTLCHYFEQLIVNCANIAGLGRILDHNLCHELINQ